MVFVAVHTMDSPVVRKFVADTNKRLVRLKMPYNPYSGRLNVIKWGAIGGVLVAGEIKPVFPRIYLFGAWLAGVWCALYYLFGLSPWFLLLPALLFASVVFWVPNFYAYMIVKGLRASGYTGHARNVRADVVASALVLRLSKC